MNPLRFRVFREKPGEISPGPCWVFVDVDGYLYIADTLPELAWLVITEWRHDRHLVG